MLRQYSIEVSESHGTARRTKTFLSAPGCSIVAQDQSHWYPKRATHGSDQS